MSLLSVIDPLYCQEHNFEVDDEQSHTMPTEQEWTEMLCFIKNKEKNTISPETYAGAGDDTYLRSARSDAVSWIAATAARHAFSALTAVLAVNYLDRCFIPSVAVAGARRGLRLQSDKPWMARLAAVAALSLAAKVEETRVPLLLDLQSPAIASPAPEDEVGCVFDCKTVRRMELLLLSSLGWRMNPVTPLSFVHHLVLRLRSEDGSGAAGAGGRVEAVVRRCEAAILAVMSDWRWVRYPASAWALAAMLFATRAARNAAALDYHETQQLISFLNAPMDKIDECYRLIVESMCGDSVIGHKRKHSCSSVLDYHCCSPASPITVIESSCFSCDNSSSSSGYEYWTMWHSTVSSSPEIQPFKMPNCIANEAFNGEGIAEDNNLFGSTFMATL